MKPSEKIPKLELFTPEIIRGVYRPYDIIISKINLIIDHLDEEWEKKQFKNQIYQKFDNGGAMPV